MMPLGIVVSGLFDLTNSDDSHAVISLPVMSHLNTRVRLGLEADGGADLLPRLNWSVQEDPSLNEADAEEVRS
jgi:hypothetical protein